MMLFISPLGNELAESFFIQNIDDRQVPCRVGTTYMSIGKSTFIKIAISFTSLIPCPIPPTDDRENTERRANLYRALAANNSALFLRLSPKKVSSVPEKVD